MKLVFKIFGWPVILLLRVFCLLGTTIYKLAAYVVSPVLLIGLGCCVYCAVQARWTELAIFAVTEMTLILGLFMIIWLVAHAEDLQEWMLSKWTC